MPFSKTVSLFTSNRLDPLTGCWNWMGRRDKRGYGYVRYFRKMEMVHRVAMHCWRGFDLQSKLLICHRCDNPSCFNPKHLFVGTQKENIADSRTKNRHFYASRTHCPQGHPYSGTNLIVYSPSPGRPSERRGCRICKRENQRRRRVEARRKNMGYEPGSSS